MAEFNDPNETTSSLPPYNPDPVTPPSGAVMIDPSKSGISAKGQQLARATGVAYKDLANNQKYQEIQDPAGLEVEKLDNNLAHSVNINDGTSYVDKSVSTVQGQMETLLDKNSEYMRLAESKAREKAAGRGLSNSSIAGRQGQLAAIESALPIAQQDAQTFAKAQAMQQQAEYNIEQIKAESISSGVLLEQKNRHAQLTQNLQNAFQAEMTGIGEQGKALMQDFQNAFTAGQNKIQQAHEKALLDTELSSKDRLAMAELAQSAMTSHAVAVENLYQDPDFLRMGSTAITQTVNNIGNLTANNINMVAGLFGIKGVTTLTNAYIPDIKWSTGNWKDVT